MDSISPKLDASPTVTGQLLSVASDWAAVRESISATSTTGDAVDTILDYIKQLGGQSVLVEESYFDRDFTAEYASFYARLFKHHSKTCRRLHFFDIDATQISQPDKDPSVISDELEKASAQSHYLGFIVVRPLAHAPLGRVVLAAPADPPGMKSELLVRSTYDVHLLGATLRVSGNSFTQQDARISACAHASIWVSARHFHMKHKGAWLSTVDINESATRVTDQVLAQSLPAGSNGLSVDSMVRALREIDRQPLLYGATKPLDGGNFEWPSDLQPQAIIHRYIDSGIPVILVLSNGQSLHAVVATGVTRSLLDDSARLSTQATRADFCSYILVNDDQRGTNLRLPISSGLPLSQTPYTIKNVAQLVVPLPPRVLIPAEHAEQASWENIRKYRNDWDRLKSVDRTLLGASFDVGEKFCREIDSNNVVARTYLTLGWRYKERMVRNRCSQTFRKFILDHNLPRNVWVTEFGTRTSFNCLDDRAAHIFAHSVVDATSSSFWDGSCLFHAPGHGARWVPNKASATGSSQTEIICLDDGPYGIKIRGQ